MRADGDLRAPSADVRLVPAALAAWLAALGVTSTADPRGPATAALLCAAAAVLALLRVVPPRRAPTADLLDRAAPLAGLALVAAACVLTSGSVQVAQRVGAVPPSGTEVVLEGRVLADPRPTGEGRHRVRIRTTAPTVHTVPAGSPVPTVPTGSPVPTGHEEPTDPTRSTEGVRDAGAVLVPAGRSVVVEGPGWADVPFRSLVRVSGSMAPSGPEQPEVARVSARPPEVLGEAGQVARQVTALRTGLADRAAGSRVDGLGLVPGTALGDTRSVPPAVRRALRVTGLAHVTAVSGAHVAVVLGAVLGLLAVSRLRPVARSSLAAAALVGFALLVQAGPSVLRATLMGGVVLLGPVLGRPSRALPALAAVVVGMLVVDPWATRDVGFRLSVAATAGIVLLASRLAARLPLPTPLGTAVAVPVVAQAACTPVLLLAGDEGVGPYAVIANALAVPALPVATLAGVSATLLGPFLPGAAEVLVLVAGTATRWIAGVAVTLSGFPGAWLPVPGGPVAVGIACVGVLLVAALAARPHRGT